VPVIHEAFVYATNSECTDTLVPFLREGLDAGQPAVVVLTAEQTRALRDALGADAAGVTFFDAASWYRRPGAALLAWRAALDEKLRGGAEVVRAIGEVQFGTEAGAVGRWIRYESLLDRALADRRAWVVCLYDRRTLPGHLVDEARRSHAFVSTGDGRRPSAEHYGAHEVGAELVAIEDAAPEPGVVPEDVASLRRAIVRPARAAGVPRDVVEDLVLAVRELGPGSTVRTRQDADEWSCEVDVPAGIEPLALASLPLTIGRVIADRVELGSSRVRFVFATRPPDPGRRILAAASELFMRDGVRSTGVNAIIARAGVARATFYSYFPSKDALVVAWLRSTELRWIDDVRAEADARAASPADRVTTFFEVLGEWLEEEDFRGCPFINAAAELSDRDHAAHEELARCYGAVEEYFRQAAADAGLADPDGLASQLGPLVPGVITVATVRRSAAPAIAAGAAAAHCLAASSASQT
jgi:AcrR family transcriptional regulator